MQSIRSILVLSITLTLAACPLPPDTSDDGHTTDSDSERGSSSDDGHGQGSSGSSGATSIGGSGTEPAGTTTGDTGCEPTDCPEVPPDSCTLPEGGSSCQSITFVGTVICEDAGLGDWCWWVVAAQYGLADPYPAIAAMLCEPGAAATCLASGPATCTMADVTTCEANAAAQGIDDPSVPSICEALVAEAF